MLPVPRYARKLPVDRTSADDLCPIEWSRFLDRPVFTLGPFDESNCIADKNVLITGAAGSIGSALAMRLTEGLPQTLILLDHSKHNLHRLYKAYKQRM
jgi:FlaA1/EpsC-like NDP-sugar epimerase